MAKRKQETSPEKTCGSCVHEFACGLWNVGSLTYADAGHCVSYETLSDLTRYACSVCSEKGKANDQR